MRAERTLLTMFVVSGCLMMTAQVFGMRSAPLWAIPEESSAYVHPVYNEDQLEGNWKQFKGEIKKKWADLTDDDLLYIEGKKDKLEGKIQERYGDRKEEVKEWVDKWFEEHSADREHGNR